MSNKRANYNEYDVRQNDLPKRLQEDFGISERLTVGVVESLRTGAGQQSIPDEKGVTTDINEEGYAEGLVDDEGEKIYVDDTFARMSNDNFDIIVSRTDTGRRRDDDTYVVRGWKR